MQREFEAVYGQGNANVAPLYPSAIFLVARSMIPVSYCHVFSEVTPKESITSSTLFYKIVLQVMIRWVVDTSV